MSSSKYNTSNYGQLPNNGVLIGKYKRSSGPQHVNPTQGTVGIDHSSHIVQNERISDEGVTLEEEINKMNFSPFINCVRSFCGC